MSTKCFAYLRVSSQGQLSGDGFGRQREAIKRYCKGHSLEVAEWYEEQITGTEQNRPVLARLMVGLESNGYEIRTVVIERLDRLARDLMVQEAIIQDFRKIDAELISTTEGPDLASGDPTRKLIRQVFGAVAEYDKTMLVQKLRAARDRKRIRTNKKVEGAKWYGEDNEQEQAVLRSIRAMRRTKRGGHKGKTLKAVANHLNKEGILTKHGRSWTAIHVHRVLKKRRK